MTIDADDARALEDILAAIEESDGDVRDVDIDVEGEASVSSRGSGSLGPIFTFGRNRSKTTVFTLEIAVEHDTDSKEDDNHETTSIEIGSESDHDQEEGHDPVDPLETIPGVGGRKADALREAGFETIEAIREADQSVLADIDAIGNALAARIKADVDGPTEADDEEVSESVPIGDQVERDDLECPCGPDDACSICGGDSR